MPDVPLVDGGCPLDARTTVPLAFGALIASGASDTMIHRCVGDVRDAGLSPDDVVSALLTLAPTVGFGRIVSAAPSVARALGYDLDTALEALDDPPPP